MGCLRSPLGLVTSTPMATGLSLVLLLLKKSTWNFGEIKSLGQGYLYAQSYMYTMRFYFDFFFASRF